MRTKQSGVAVAEPVSLPVVAVGLVAMAIDLPNAWLVWPLGYGVALPLTVAYAKRRTREPQVQWEQASQDRLAAAKRRYVDGDIDEAEFERAVETAIRREESP